MIEGTTQGRHPARNNLTINNPRLLLDRTEGNNRHLTRVNNRGTRINTQRTDVRNGQGTVRHLSGLSLTLTGASGQVVQRNSQLTQGQLLSVLNVRNHQAARGRRSNTQVHEVLNLDFAIGPGRVDLRVTLSSPNDRGGKHQQRGDLHALKVAGLLQALHELHGAGGINIHENRHVRGAKRRRNHRLRGSLTHATHRDALNAVTGGGCGLPERLAGAAMLHIAQVRHIVHEVLLGHLAARTGSGHVRQINTQLLCGKTHRRRREGRAVRNLLGSQSRRGSRCGLGCQTLHHRVQRGVLHKAGGALSQLAQQALVAVRRVSGGVRHGCLNSRCDRCRSSLCGLGSGGGALAGATLHSVRLGAGADQCGAGLSLCRGGCRRGCGCVVAAGDADDWGAHLNGFTFCNEQCLDGAGEGRRKFHNALCGFNFDEDVVDGDLGADCHLPAEDFCFGQAFTHVRERENLGHFYLSLGHIPYTEYSVRARNPP